MLLFNTLSVYGLIYAAGFIVFTLVKHPFVTAGSLSYRLFISIYTSIAVIVGGRAFYVLIYEPAYYMQNITEIFELYKGGMSFHGAFVLCIAMLFVLDRRNFLTNLDRACLCAMIMLPLGRVVNFLNGELYGRASTLPFAVIFEGGGQIARHPSQLYEAIAEGPLIAFIIFILYRLKTINKCGQIACTFAILYAIFRFVIEFTREPDLSVGYIANFFSAGQILCLVQLILSLVFYKVFVASDLKAKE